MANRTRGVAFVVALALISSVATAFADTGTWMPTSVRGVVVYLLDGKWQEVVRGQGLSQAKLRTLRSGRLSLAGPNVILDVGPNSALQLAVGADGSGATVEQYLGSINVTAQRATGGLMVRAGKLTLTAITGELSVLVAGNGASIVIQSGTAALIGPKGQKQLLDTGTYSADASGAVVEQSASKAAPVASTAQATQAQSAASPPTGSGSNNGIGNANGAANGNSGNNGNGGGNSSNNGNGNSGNNGNGNSGNGNGNSGNNGNGTSGNNGNGNGNTGNNGNGKGNKP